MARAELVMLFQFRHDDELKDSSALTAAAAAAGPLLCPQAHRLSQQLEEGGQRKIQSKNTYVAPLTKPTPDDHEQGSRSGAHLECPFKRPR